MVINKAIVNTCVLLLLTGQCFKDYTCINIYMKINIFNLHSKPLVSNHYPHFTDEELNTAQGMYPSRTCSGSVPW